MMRPIALGILSGVIAFTATTAVTIVTSAQLSGWREPQELALLLPASASAPGSPTGPQETPTNRGTLTTRTELSIPLSDGKTSAVLVEPQSGTETAVVLIAGAGDSDRSTLLPLAECFAEAGIAALTYDKRTDGYSTFHRDYAQLADDALAAVSAMKAETGIERIGAWGISEGGWVLSSALAREPSSLAFAVLASAPVVTPLEQTAWIIDRALQDSPDLIRRAGATVVAQGRSLFDYLDFDARPFVAETRVPVMAIWGADDSIVPVNEAYRRMHADLDGELLAYVVPGLSHDVTADPSAWVSVAASWMKAPAGDGLFGVDPTSALGVSAPVEARWHADPRLHLALSVLVAGVVGALVYRRSTKGRRSLVRG